MKIAVIGMGLIGGSFYKAALQAGYSCRGFDRQDVPELGDCDMGLLALPQEALPGWAAEYGNFIRPGTIVVDTCGMKAAICKELTRLLPKNCLFVGGHPMAGKEKSGFAYSEAGLFKGASMILTPCEDTPHSTLEFLEVFFGRLGFSRVVCTTPERHDAMIAYTRHMVQVNAAAYTQLPQSSEARPYAAGSYANMTRIASMQPQVRKNCSPQTRTICCPFWTALLSACRHSATRLPMARLLQCRSLSRLVPPARRRMASTTMPQSKLQGTQDLAITSSWMYSVPRMRPALACR